MIKSEESVSKSKWLLNGYCCLVIVRTNKCLDNCFIYCLYIHIYSQPCIMHFSIFPPLISQLVNITKTDELLISEIHRCTSALGLLHCVNACNADLRGCYLHPQGQRQRHSVNSKMSQYNSSRNKNEYL